MPDSFRVRGLYAIADTSYLDDVHLVPAVEQALRGGARVIQYRDKTHSTTQRTLQASALRALCAKHGACFIINDDVELARTVGADGVHIGREDAAIEIAKRDLGVRGIVGVSCYNDFARAEAMIGQGASYVAFGSFFPSRTKPNALRAPIDLLRAARSRFDVPLVAIGGITPENGATLVNAGADALAVISGVFDQVDVETSAQRYAALFPKADNA